MTSEELYQLLNSGRINKQDVERIVARILEHPELVKPLLEETYAHDVEDNFMASWVLDHLMRTKLNMILPILDDFLDGMAHLKSESSIRPAAHICQLLAEAYFKNKNTVIRNAMTSQHLEQISTICFDWLIQKHKVATHVFAMTSLFYLGEKFDWIRPELKSVLEQNFASGSAGFQNRGGKILDKLKKLGY